MSSSLHKVFLGILITITFGVTLYLALYGYNYYITDISERFFHPKNDTLKPSGFIGHGIGIIGSLLIIIGVAGYMIRKRWRFMTRFGRLSHWLEWHIFMCILGSILILFHTSFKFHGIVSISFWSMVAVVISGVIGRYIYLQIPRSIEGRELTLNELSVNKSLFFVHLNQQFNLDDDFISYIETVFESNKAMYEGPFFSNFWPIVRFERKLKKSIKNALSQREMKRSQRKNVWKFIHSEIVLNRRIAWLTEMQNYLRYWHVAHLPFALIMLIIMLIHIVIAVLFGHVWIF